MSSTNVWETRSYRVEWLETPLPASHRKLLVATYKKLKEFKKQKFLLFKDTELKGDDKIFREKKLAMEIRSLNDTTISLQKPKKALYLIHKKTGVSNVFHDGNLADALHTMRQNVKFHRKENKQIIYRVEHVHKLLQRRRTTHILSAAPQGQDIIALTKVGLVHTKCGTYKELSDVIKLQQAKEPRSAENHVGIEIEFASFLGKKDIVSLLINSGLDNNCQLHHEFIQGRHGDENEYEISLTSGISKFPTILKRLCDMLNDQADANITFGCGLHVHIDCRNRDEKKVYNNLFHAQSLLYSMVNPSRQNNRFANRTDKQYWYPINRDVRCEKCEEVGDDCACATRDHVPKNHQNRYTGINTWSFLKHRTIEVRMHSGTSNYRKIVNWVNLLSLIADAVKFKGEVKNVVELCKLADVSDELNSYIISRVKSFNKEEN